MNASKVFVLQLLYFLGVICYTEPPSLLSILVAFRHGARTPVHFYKNDPYDNASYWPEGIGQMTLVGEQQVYQLGRWLRSQYKDFLLETYANEEFYVRSTEKNRSQMSALLCMKGLYNLEDEDLKNVSVHVVPESYDILFNPFLPCPKHSSILKSIQEKQYKDMCDLRDSYSGYLTNCTGETVSTFDDISALYNTLSIESYYNLTLPDWTQSVFPKQLYPLHYFAYLSDCLNEELARLRIGPFFHEILKYFSDVVSNKTNYKLRLYSVQDYNLLSTLQTIGYTDKEVPPFASAVVFELWKNQSMKYIKIKYKKNDKIKKILFRNGQLQCRYDVFINLFQTVALNPENWEKECSLTSTVNYIVIVCIVLAVIFIVLSILFVLKFRNHYHHIISRLMESFKCQTSKQPHNVANK